MFHTFLDETIPAGSFHGSGAPYIATTHSRLAQNLPSFGKTQIHEVPGIMSSKFLNSFCLTKKSWSPSNVRLPGGSGPFVKNSLLSFWLWALWGNGCMSLKFWSVSTYWAGSYQEKGIDTDNCSNRVLFMKNSTYYEKQDPNYKLIFTPWQPLVLSFEYFVIFLW